MNAPVTFPRVLDVASAIIVAWSGGDVAAVSVVFVALVALFILTSLCWDRSVKEDPTACLIVFSCLTVLA